MANKTSRIGFNKTAKQVVAASGLVAVFGAAAAAAAPTAVAASDTANSGEVATQVRKSVTLSGNPDGSINSSASAMVTQVSSVGNGQAQIQVPVGASSARNLDGFSSVPFDGQSAVFNMNPNGNQEQRIYTSSDDGPITVKVTATLDGVPIDPDQVVNQTGVLDVNYTVVNTETQKEEVTYKDVNGNVVTQEMEMASPIGGSVDITLPQGFNEVTAKGAQIGGDGQGGTKLSYSLVLFEPLGSRIANFGYQTRIQEGTLPKAVFTFLPIIPLENSTIATTKEAYSGGADTGATIYGAGVEIGENLAKIQSGATQLTEGLATAADGASKLATAFNTQIVPNADKIASGANDLNDGLTGEFNTGLTALTAGIASLKEGVDNLPASVQEQLDDNEEYQYGLLALNIVANGGTDPIFGTIPSPAQAKGSIDRLYAAAQDAPAGTCDAIPSPPAPSPVPSCDTAKAASQGYITYASTVAAVLGAQLPTLITTVLDGIQATLLGTQQKPGVNALNVGAQQLKAGFDSLILPGSEALAAGTTEFADALPEAADGATQIADGLPAAVSGTEEIASGAGQLQSEGTDKLAASGESAQADYAFKVAQINAIQQIGLSGSNIPYGPATGPNTTTTGVYQLTLAAASQGPSNGLVFGLAAVGLIVAGAAGVYVWRRP